MRIVFAFSVLVLLSSCKQSIVHERWIANATDDTVYVWNPDFEDTIFTIAPSEKEIIYSYEILNYDQGSVPCQWQGDSLHVKNEYNVPCNKPTSVESNWFSDLSGGKKDRKQVCTFTVYDTNF